MTLIRYDPTGVFIEHGGIGRGDLAKLRPQLEQARAEVLADADLWARGGDVPAAKQPLDAGFHHLPERLLDEHAGKRETSLLARLQKCADRLSGG